MYPYDDELTGYEEHVRDEAYECGEIAAMREEARREAEMEAAMAEAEQREQEEEDARRYPHGFCDGARDRDEVCMTLPEWEAKHAEDQIPF